MMLEWTCSDCLQRDLCTGLCPEAELYVDQDNNLNREGKNEYEKPHFSPLEQKIVRLVIEGKGPSKICKLLDITKDSYYVRLHSIRKKILP